MENKNVTPGKVKRDWKGGCRYLAIWGVGMFLLLFILMLIQKSDLFTKKPNPINICFNNISNLTEAIKDYSELNEKHYPQNLKVLVQEFYIYELPTCPVSRVNYIYEIEGWDAQDFTIRCPNPEKHE